MARRTTAPKAKSGKVSVDFTGVETRVLLPEGVYNAVVDEVSMEEGDKAPYLKWKFKTVDDDPKLNDKPLYNNTSLAPQSLWVLASLLDTLGVERPEGAMDIDLTELPGLEIGLIVEHEEYNGKMQSKVVDFTPANGEEGDGDEVTVEGGEGETYTTDEINEADEDTLDAVVEASGIEVKKSKKIALYRKAVLEALTEAELINDDAGDNEALDEDTILAMDEDELDALVEEHGLEVKKSKKLPVYAAAVAAAAEEAGLYGEADGDESDDGDEAGVTEDDINAMDKDELGAFVTENGLKVKALPKIAAYRAAVVAAATKADLLSEPGDEGDDLYSADDINEMDQTELAALVKEHKLKVAFGKILKKNRSLVIDALEAAELMKDE